MHANIQDGDELINPITAKNIPIKPPIMPKPLAKKRIHHGNGALGSWSVCIACACEKNGGIFLI